MQQGQLRYYGRQNTLEFTPEGVVTSGFRELNLCKQCIYRENLPDDKLYGKLKRILGSPTMTLNLMLVSPKAVYLSGDFRLSSASGPLPDDMNTQKLVPIAKSGWTALISFAGIGRTPSGLDVGAWLVAETDAIDHDAGIEELERRLVNADTWLATLGPARHHIFSVVGFNGTQPFAMVVSNFHDDQGQPLSTVNNMQSHFVAAQTTVLVRGWEPAVLPKETDNLRESLQNGVDPLQLQIQMAEVNEAAAGRSSTISRECVTGHLLSDGSGEVTPRGISDAAAYMPPFVRRSLQNHGIRGFLCKSDARGNRLSPYWVGMTLKRDEIALLMLHAIRNVTEPCTAVIQSPLFWKNEV